MPDGETEIGVRPRFCEGARSVREVVRRGGKSWSVPGLPCEQAAAIVEAQKDAFAEALDVSLATKADIARLESRLDGMGKDMQAIELRLTVKLGVFIAAAVGILIAVLRMPH